ncbi:hypothetical protein M406DRAFT_323868 [Cryphonectria parasitica EP155]|uniref:Uncharacterized protein n=1 Tax=Cryphonectria parasitica (strain ATCC 38755 / EP155) TaxID=660469 RepID=A0A9P4XV76_CRYP1|nr:uncharacterized protein M406DRAFT_323868 [Cryphonectria parasitica EP155]KAF3761442.1 hypothetical protein M406DRAFT_323868 [Cryphonectria parasitica EP155]
MSFASYGDYSLGVPATASPYDSNPHTPALSHSFDHSGSSDAASEPEWSVYPATPLSMGSP